MATEKMGKLCKSFEEENLEALEWPEVITMDRGAGECMATGNGQNCVNPCKRENSGASGVARSYYNSAGRWRSHGHWRGGKTV